MIKKLSIAAAVVAVGLVVAVVLFVRAGGPSDGARLVSAEAVAFFSLNDLPRSFIRWQGTALAQIGKEPEVKAFLERPVSQMVGSPGAGETGSVLAGLKPARGFVAVGSVSAERTDALLGFQYWGGRKDFDAAVEKMKGGLPPGKTSKDAHSGDEILVSQHGGMTLYSGTHGRWGFIGTSLEMVKFALDRAAGRGEGASLAENPAFVAVSKKMLDAPDVSLFVQPGRILDALLEAGRAMGAQSIPQQIEQIRSVKALGGSLKLDGLLQRDAIFLLTDNGAPADHLTHKNVRFTGPATVFFVDFVARLGGLDALLGKALEGSASREEIVELVSLSADAFGPEGAFVLNWDPMRTIPSGVATFQIRDAAKADLALGRFLRLFPSATSEEFNGTRLYSIPSTSNPFASPMLALTDGVLLVAMDRGSIEEALTKDPKPIDGLPVFSSALSEYRSANEVFGFMDTRMVFERAYAKSRDLIIFWAGLMPSVSATIDVAKLPQGETIGRHLPPIVFSQQRLPDGVLLQSSGPFTVSQFAIAGAAGGVVGSRRGR